jgi:hypothetical protein
MKPLALPNFLAEALALHAQEGYMSSNARDYSFMRPAGSGGLDNFVLHFLGLNMWQ